MDNFYRKLQYYRLERGYNYQHVEDATGIPKKKLYNAEKGIDHLTVEELETLLHCYGITLAEISTSKLKKRKGLVQMLLVICALFLFASLSFYLYKEGLIFKPELLVSTSLDVETTVLREEEQATALNDRNEGKIADSQARSIGQQVIGEETNEATQDEDIQAAKPIESVVPTAKTTLRFWGDVWYHQDAQVDLAALVHDQAFNIIPLKHVSAGEQPVWLEELAKNQVLFKVGTTYLKQYNTRTEVQRLQELGYPIIGLDVTPDVYEPYIIEKDNVKIGVLPLARLIHQVEDIAGARHIGFPKAYDSAIASQAVYQAKEKTDFLVVLMDWGGIVERGSSRGISTNTGSKDSGCRS